MKSEKIIANIERYVNGLSDEKRQMYEKAFDYTEAENRNAKTIYPIIELAEIVQVLKREMKEKAQKEANGSSYVKRSKLIAKLIDKANDGKRLIKKAWCEDINGEKMQCCIIGGYYAFALRNPLDLPTVEENDNCLLTIKKVLPDYRDFEKLDITKGLAEFKMALKLHKAQKDKTFCNTVINEKWYRTEYLINVIEGLGECVTLYQNPNKLSHDVFESKNGIAILCPVRPPETK